MIEGRLGGHGFNSIGTDDYAEKMGLIKIMRLFKSMAYKPLRVKYSKIWCEK